LGTSGSIQPDTPSDPILVSERALSVDALHAFYPHSDENIEWQEDLRHYFNLHQLPTPYCFSSSMAFSHSLATALNAQLGITYTASGFYAPQGRRLFTEGEQKKDLNQILCNYRFEGSRITNIEMETAALFHLGRLFGHSIASVSALLANRVTGEFSTQAEKTIDSMIASAIEFLLNEPH
jgi:uridine phosphorylase